MTQLKHIFLLIPMLMVGLHPVFVNNAQAATQEQTCKKWQTKNANGQCIDSLEYKKCTKQNANNNSHWDESANKCVCDNSKYEWDSTLGICKAKQESTQNKKATKTANEAATQTKTTTTQTQRKTCNIPHAEEQYYDEEQKKCLVELGGCEIGYTTNENQTKCVINKGGFCIPQERDPNASLDGGYEINAQAKCVLVKCNTGYKPKENKCVVAKGGKCTPTIRAKYSTSYKYNEQAKCTLSECEKGYKADGNKCVVNEGATCEPDPATKKENGIYKYKDNKGTAECVITGCTSGTLRKGYCAGDYNGPTKKITGHVTGTAEGDQNGIEGAEIYPVDPEYQVTVSRIRTDTNGNFTFDKFPADETAYCVRADSSKYEKKCVSIETTEVQLTETATDLQELEATADLNCNNETMLKKLNTTKAIKKSSEDGAICEPVKDACIDGYAYVEQDGKAQCVLSDDASDDEETKDPTSTTTTPSNTMTEEQKAEIAEKEAKVQELKEKEQSLENRMTTAVSMGGAGIGGMMLAESLSEQRVDEQSEQDMAAYIETFRCTYAGGKSVKGGATEVQLPADTLFDLYQEYIALAADVKTMKEQLDLMPGIESDVVMDKATMGLYDDQSSGKINGTYASLYRTLTDESSEDAQQWADQKAKTDKNKKIGIGVGVGAAALGGIGNILTNHVDWDKTKGIKIGSTSEEDPYEDEKQNFKDALEKAGIKK